MCMHMWSRASAFPTAPNSQQPSPPPKIQNLDILASFSFSFYSFCAFFNYIFFHSHRESKI